MSNEGQKPQQSEEVDLGQLFKVIGKGFERFFKFIASIFIGIYNLIIALLAHFYKRKIWYALAVIIGVIIGFVLDVKSDKTYGANMYVETNFNSSRQVYENIKQLNQLTIDKDSLRLASILNVEPFQASKLNGFFISPSIDENQVAEMYSEFYTKLDSLSRTEMTYDRYLRSLTATNYPIHQIGVIATDKSIFKKIEPGVKQKLIDNPYLENLVLANKRNLEMEEKALQSQIQKTDSLANEYLKIRINESRKDPVQGSGTNLYMAGDSNSNGLLVDESKVIEKRLDLEELRREVNLRKAQEFGVINIVAGFPETGYDVRGWADKKKFMYPIVLFGLTFAFFAFLGLGKFLEAESKK
ncbi:hypothetical protein JJL45_03285 [Tamlana sp. s12]|uniref:hypothetical protein n=1 Tax=Tamlana sp. s12 TaxID=1630406 RepID=UPI0007FCB8DD|nr:hypothetical protein [Tamlana sp. s12]OBQ54924.1 hypothetical protein VQ01_09260 [Tamlana sp. s12]QQY83031.1 hypothetical protein JJL45_03285 [Tamlana sp. s12]